MSVDGHVNGSKSIQVEEHDSTAHQACYVFQGGTDTYQNARRPPKRRKTEKANSALIPPVQTPFSALLDGCEKPENLRLRHAAFHEQWSKQQIRVESILQDANSTTLEELAEFVKASPESYHDKIPTGLILAGPNIAAHGKLFEQMAVRVKAEAAGPVVILHSGQASNLKTALKQLIKGATSQTQGVQEDDILSDQRKGPKLLNYDLQILYDYVQTHAVRNVVVGFQDSEAFDGNLLADLISIFSSWLDRIPFILLFGIATSVDLFNDKLPRSTIRCMQAEKFDVTQVEESIESVFVAATAQSNSGILWLGPSLSSMLLERQRDHVQSVQAFYTALKYAYMAHFYANPLSILLASDVSHGPLQSEHFEAIRNLPSFRRYAQEQMAIGNLGMVRDLLNDDSVLFETVLEQLNQGQAAVNDMNVALDYIETIRSYMHSNADIQRSELYVKAMSRELAGSAMIRDLLVSVKKLPSDRLAQLLSQIPDLVSMELSDLHDQLQTLLKARSSHGNPLRSEHDVRHETLRTTVVAQKVELSKQRSSLSKDDAAYSKIVNRVHDVLQSYFSRTLINPQSLFLHEIFIYDLKSPHRDVFTAKPRFAIERALSAPHDYLGCSCCNASEEGLSSTQPSTPILYQLYLESGALINVFDLWSAFYAIVGREDGDDDDEQKALALFYRALAELKFMGMIKYSKKKTDHLAKLSWKGL